MQQTLMARFDWRRDAAAGATYWTDGWDGYAPSRNRLLGAAAARKLGGLVVLGGDVHSHYVADLKADFDDPASPVIASEFCGSSITSLSMPQTELDAHLPFNPHIRYGPLRPARLYGVRARPQAVAGAHRSRRTGRRSTERGLHRSPLRRRGWPAGRAAGLSAAARPPSQNKPSRSAAPSTDLESSLICAPTSFDGGEVALAVHTSRPLPTSVTRPLAE